MKHLMAVSVLLVLSSALFAQSSADSIAWVTDVAQAHAISKSTGKPIFAFFTGSDWCGWCRKLQAEVFAKPAFKQWANNEVVLLELDFPARKVLPEQTVQQNESLKNFFQIKGFPTIWLFCINEDQENAKRFIITPYGALGYPQNPVAGHEEVKFLDDAGKIIASRKCN